MQYMIYSTGDSLGGDLDKRCEIIGATYDVYLAYKIKHYIGEIAKIINKKILIMKSIPLYE